MKKQKREREYSGEMLLTLCARCAQQFFDSGEHNIRRADPNQKVKDTCCYYGQRLGWDYRIRSKTLEKRGQS